MKICRFLHDNVIKTGVLGNEFITSFKDNKNNDFADMFGINKNEYSDNIKLDDIKFLPPTTPSKIVCIGRNYAEHAAELGNEVPAEPLIFLKAPSSLITNDETILLPAQSNQVEHEGELAVVIGRVCKNLSEQSNPVDYVAGYTCLNDVTARDLQRGDIQFTRAKSFDTFCPIGHFIETRLDVSDLQITTKVNGVLKQKSKTSRMVFPVPFLIKYISRQMTLFPGDIIATGTPSGVSQLKSGDVCEIQIEGIGLLRNKVE